MSTHTASLRRAQTDLPTQTSSPLRHDSTASTNSSIYSVSSSSFAPSRTSTVSSNASVGSATGLGHKRGSSEVNTAAMHQNMGVGAPEWSNAGATYKDIRRSLRPLTQAPNSSPPANKHVSFRHSRSQTVDNPQYWKENRPQTPETSYGHNQDIEPLKEKGSPNVMTSPKPSSPHPDSPHARSHVRTNHSHSISSSHPPQLTAALSAPELETFQKSSTGHLRALSKFAKSGATEEFSIDTFTPSVVGLHGRRRLKRSDSVAANHGSRTAQRPTTSAWTAGHWMDAQRQFLQAYEYLCHIGEAKEWIEEIIQQQIPPIVQLEEALRDGVTLAEIVQSMYPNRALRIFRHPKLQYRHSDNIALFFRFLDEVELPELFRFELIDLYEKKNIPKVIHCIHALSWLLFKNGLVDFRMGNLVGQLQFEDHELEQTQKGLDKAGVSMPSFTGMAANFGAEPEPEPESEEDRIDRELHENEDSIVDFQAQLRGAMLRLNLGNLMNDLWDFEPLLVELQSMIRADWTRQIVQYRIDMRKFAVNLQANCRGFIARHRQRDTKQNYKALEKNILQFQSAIRGSKARVQAGHLRIQLLRQESGIKQIQAAVRGALQRKAVYDLYDDVSDAEGQIRLLQAAIRGALQRSQVSKQHEETQWAEENVQGLQAAIRGSLLRSRMGAQSEEIAQTEESADIVQAAIRGMLLRQNIAQTLSSLGAETKSIVSIQAYARAAAARKSQSAMNASLSKEVQSFIHLQSMVRGGSLRKDIGNTREALAQHSSTLTDIQSTARANALRSFLESQREALAKESNSVLYVQSMSRGVILRARLEEDRSMLQQEESAIVELQALARAAVLRIHVGGILEQLDECDYEISELQAHIRAMIVRVNVGQTLAELAAEEDIITDFQSRIRGHVVRAKFEEKRRYYQENMEKVVKAQSFVRGRIQGQAYKSLTSGKNPPVGTVKGFVHLLNDSEFDFDEEIESDRTRKLVVQQVRQNEMAEQYISQLDIKIALLVKNKITLDEVVKHQKHFGGHVGNLLSNTEISSKDPFDLKALNKTSRRKLEYYQVFFFLLQTQSQYLAKLFRRLREVNTPEKEYERIRHLMMGLFGYSQKRREEYYLIKLLARSAREEIESFTSIHEYLRCSSFWNKLFASYIKSPRDRKFMRDVLSTAVRENIVENSELDLESDPIQIYRSAINNEELRTGQRSRRPLDIPREEAIRDPETRATFIQHLQDLRDIADQFFAALEELLYRMPFGIRYIAKDMYESLLSRFSNEDPGYILQTVGHWVWKNYFQPAIMEPEKFGVVDRGLTQEQKRNLSEIAKVIAQASSGRLFGAENVYLQPLNTYIAECIQRLGDIWGECKFLISRNGLVRS